MSILVTGSAGFIGFSTAKKLLSEGKTVIGIDSLNEYYDVSLKKDRLKILQEFDNFTFKKVDIAEKENLFAAVEEFEIEYIIHLAAQAGVRYSIENPEAYIQSNLIGHFNMIELARNLKTLKHFVYASSSSVYGANEKLPFSVKDQVDTPISLYAATKKSDEMLSYSYSHLYNIPMTGLRFFTVYGPWGRPDMAAFIFTDAILKGKEFEVFNQGNMRRNFTYIDDIVSGTIGCMNNPPQKEQGKAAHKVYNIGNNKSEELMHFINTIEKITGKEGKKIMAPMQPGDVKETIADIEDTQKDFGFEPKTNIEEGLANFVNWYREYYNV